MVPADVKDVQENVHALNSSFPPTSSSHHRSIMNGNHFDKDPEPPNEHAQDFDIDLRDQNHQLLFNFILENNLIEATLMLTSFKPDPEWTDEYGHCLLHAACIKGMVPMVESLLDAGLCVHKQDADEKTPFYYSIKKGNLEVVKLLVSRFPELINPISFFQIPPLLVAIQFRRKDIFKYTLDTADSYPDQQTLACMQVIDVAIDSQQSQMVQMIFQKLPSLLNRRIGGRFGLTPLQVALANKDKYLANLLKKLGARMPVEGDEV